MDRSEFLAEYRRRVNEYAQAVARGDDPSKACAAERRQAEQFVDRKTDPWGWLRVTSEIISRHNPL
jgi:hypothetical protein